MRRTPLPQMLSSRNGRMSSTSGEFQQSLYTVLGLLIGVKATGMENLTTIFLVFLIFCFLFMYAAETLKAYPDRRGFGAFIKKISNLFGILAFIFALLIIVQAYGSVPLFLWSTLALGVAVAVVILLRLAFVKFKLMMRINGHLMEYWTRFCGTGRSTIAEPELTMNVCSTDLEAQDQNQMKELPPV